MANGVHQLGSHIIMEFNGCPRSILLDSDRIEKSFIEAVRLSGASLVRSFFHRFNPHGVSGVIIIKESHFSIHTWPEYGYAAIDFFTCSKNVNVNEAIEYLKKELSPSSVSVIEIKRGII